MGKKESGILKRNELHKSVEFIIIFVMIYYSGTVYSVSIYHKYAILLFVGFAIVIYMYRGRQLILKANIVLISIIASSALIVSMLWASEDFDTYVAIVIQFIGVTLLSQCLASVRFEYIYIKIMKWLAITSLLAFVLGLLFPQIIYLFPHTPAITHCEYYNAGIYVYNVSIYTKEMLRRNNSIFWEAGCYQAFLNLAIFFCIKHRMEFGEKNMRTMLILAVTVLTTYSFTGLVILGALILLYFTEYGKRKREMLIMGISGMGIVFLLVSVSTIKGLFYRVEEYLSNPSSILVRINADVIVDVIKKYPVEFIRGMGFANFYEKYGGMSNSIFLYFACVGVIFGVCVSLIYFKYFRNLSVKLRIAYIFIMLASCSAEGLWICPLFLMPGMLADARSQDRKQALY